MCGHLRRLLNGTMITDDELTILSGVEITDMNVVRVIIKFNTRKLQPLKPYCLLVFIRPEPPALRVVASGDELPSAASAGDVRWAGRITDFCDVKTSNARPPLKVSMLLRGASVPGKGSG